MVMETMETWKWKLHLFSLNLQAGGKKGTLQVGMYLLI